MGVLVIMCCIMKCNSFRRLQSYKCKFSHLQLSPGSEFERETKIKSSEMEGSKQIPNTNAKESAPGQQDRDDESRKQLSDNMKKKLLKEMQNSGNDPNFSRGPVLGNPILIISVIIAVLVVLGGKDILF
jgi:hypothetical protein